METSLLLCTQTEYVIYLVVYLMTLLVTQIIMS
jgi:hypothetical protein